MANSAIISIYAPFCIFTAIIFSIELLRNYKRQEDYLFTFLCFYALGWYCINILGLLSKDIEFAKFCINFMLIFVGLIPPTLLLFVIRFYKIQLNVPSYAELFLFVIPAMNVVMVFTAKYHTLLNKKLEIISLTPFRDMEIVWGNWFWVHTVYSYIISFIIIVLILYQHSRVTRFYRMPSTLMILGVSITLGGNIITLLQLIPPVIEPTLITMSLAMIFFNLAIINNNKSKFVRFSKAHIYHYLAEYILVVDEKDQIIDYNRSAEAWFSSQSISLNSTSLKTITELLNEIGEFVQVKGENEEDGIDIHIHDGVFKIILNQKIYQMKDGRNDSIGKIVMFSDVTENRMLIERLETKAGMDSLTGLPNHLAYTGAKKRLDSAECLPLCVVMCDANGLKGVNDTLGHQYGDILLQKIADVLEDVCPPSGFAARIGGDEFAFLLPHTQPDEADALIKEVKKRMNESKDLPFTLSAALGKAVKYSEEEDLDQIIALADQDMYEDKKTEKAKVIKIGEKGSLTA